MTMNIGEQKKLYDGHPLLDVLKEAEEASQKSRIDLFAAAALQGMLANPECNATVQEIAHGSWLYAQAMIEQEPK